jgi:hypothetical protein
MRLWLRRTLVQVNGEWAMVSDFPACESIHDLCFTIDEYSLERTLYFLLNKDAEHKGSDTTTDAIKYQSMHIKKHCLLCPT